MGRRGGQNSPGSVPGPKSCTATSTPLDASFRGADQQLSRPLADAAHRFDGVDNQVEDYLLQLDSISLNERQALRELRLQRDAVLRKFATGQGNDLKDRFVDLQTHPSVGAPS